jgi:uncharacterized protein with NRDE domain
VEKTLFAKFAVCLTLLSNSEAMAQENKPHTAAGINRNATTSKIFVI